MITIGMNYKVLPGKEDHFERMFNNVLHSLETVTGHSKSALYKDVNALQSYLIVSEWASEDAFSRRATGVSPRFTASIAAVSLSPFSSGFGV